MTEQHIAVCEALDWRVHDDPEEDYVELEKYSPAGEDFIFGVQKGNFVKNVREYADGFDVDEHVELWIEGRGKNGVPATARELVEDAEAIRDIRPLETRQRSSRRLRRRKPGTGSSPASLQSWRQRKRSSRSSPKPSRPRRPASARPRRPSRRQTQPSRSTAKPTLAQRTPERP